ncbi:Ig-like domain-containing protein [Methanobrevibacter filiformis]|uniref:Bacterial Ig-like domain protein n=1 Tax=Methanobrevibacter filiformis TaxID=55758 RepID=A0A166DAY6_9EURY|nr:Ig-like domain-containing protein [Methanobrevibacter filiformis]KZX15394.1 hypothetical protein MBFIL_06950 [Methanobrevibacter filiformis]
MKRNIKLHSFLIVLAIVITLVSVSSVSAAANTQINVSFDKNVTLGTDLNVTAIINSEGKAIEGKKIDFSINGEHCSGHEYSDINGTVTFNYIAGNIGEHTLRVSFAGDTEYNAYSTEIINFNVYNPNAKNDQLASPNDGINNIKEDSKPVQNNTPLKVNSNSSLKVKNSHTVKNGKLTITTILANLGPAKKTFKITYKIPKGLTYKKPTVSKGITVTYNKNPRIVTLKVNNLKVSTKNSAKIIFTLKAKKGTYKNLRPTIIGTSGLEVKSNNKITATVK